MHSVAQRNSARHLIGSYVINQKLQSHLVGGRVQLSFKKIAVQLSHNFTIYLSISHMLTIWLCVKVSQTGLGLTQTPGPLR